MEYLEQKRITKIHNSIQNPFLADTSSREARDQSFEANILIDIRKSGIHNLGFQPCLGPREKIAVPVYTSFVLSYLLQAFQNTQFPSTQLDFPTLGLRFPISHPQPRSTLTTFGVTAAATGIRIKIKLLWMAYASASCVQIPCSPMLFEISR